MEEALKPEQVVELASDTQFCAMVEGKVPASNAHRATVGVMRAI